MKKKTIRLTESDLVKIIHRVIAESEQHNMGYDDMHEEDEYDDMDDDMDDEMDDETFREIDRKVRAYNRR